MIDTTIVAVSTPQGKGATATIRISGKKALQYTQQLLDFSGKESTLHPRKVKLFAFLTCQKEFVDEVLLTYFPSPNSYTGEDVVEVSCHGSLYIQQRIVEEYIKLGALLAQPGEFTYRAFVNNKLDLAQAEAVGDLLDANHQAAHQLAMQQLRGGYSRKIEKLRKELLDFATLIELELDFSEEDVEFADRKKMIRLLSEIIAESNQLAHSFTLGKVIKNGIPTVIVGEPNVGKSSLLNNLLLDDKAIVSNIPGTTRDIIEDTINIEGQLFRFIDTAGIRDTHDLIEQIGIERSLNKIRAAYIILFVLDENDQKNNYSALKKVLELYDPKTQKILLVLNKTDKLSREQQIKIENDIQKYFADFSFVGISTFEQETLSVLRSKLLQITGSDFQKQNHAIISNLRHYEALQKAADEIQLVVQVLEHGQSTDVAAFHLRKSIDFLGEITGVITPDDILQNIFKNFCIGK